MAHRPRVTVLGSLNTDISVAVPRLPRPGETVLGSGAAIGAGGKGANQAVGAARLGALVRMIGCRGDDEFGGALTAALAEEGVDTRGVRVIAGAASGLALITVDSDGENTITVAPGANALAGGDEVDAAAAAGGDVLVGSAEIPGAVLASALARARADGVTTLLNLAPARPGSASLLAGGVDWLVVNAGEAVTVLGGVAGAGGGAGWVRGAARDLVRGGAGHAVITRGPDGAVLAGAAGELPVPGFAVRSVDSTGAGDAFVAGLAVALAAGMAPADAVRAACAVGATATLRRGAQAGAPRPAEVLAATGLDWPVRA